VDALSLDWGTCGGGGIRLCRPPTADRRQLHRGGMSILIRLKRAHGLDRCLCRGFGPHAPPPRYSRIAAAEVSEIRRNSDALRRKISDGERSADFAWSDGSRFRERFGFKFGRSFGGPWKPDESCPRVQRVNKLAIFSKVRILQCAVLH